MTLFDLAEPDMTAEQLQALALLEGQSPTLEQCGAALGLLRPAEKVKALDDLDTPKTCSRCGNVYPLGDFPITTARGRLLVRSWCVACCEVYQQTFNARRRTGKKTGRPRRGVVVEGG